MESAISQVQFSEAAATSSVFDKKSNNGVSRPVFLSLPFWNSRKERRGLRVECGFNGSLPPSLSELNSEEEMIGMKKLIINESCRVDDMVELLECLEKEAIMGDDKGRDPNDYNRRAQIFNKSSKVFQALKHSQSSSGF